ncbi:hypothetical protein QE450_003677 [Paenibacillus sp. SORGH_AS306]|uniref:hypothetical protein n=1 Tax=unclassified Paenibacillus TaxID=185978 RepID=UPI0023662F21|nr:MULTISPECIES: hypothetical protein [unclassified Paenibacillus]MDQ1236179.1 hypothetical protein [Paenibacillus sp. SORGH_AS_0306]MDR6108534.1 hypothetical protein [Paenibacillus sp. SORGH_AS_0338]WDF51211.1 hypothetical protein PQ460_01765 [Paenibacillus sp. KACC 21273]
MKETENIKSNSKNITIIFQVFAGLFLLLTLYYIGCSVWAKDDFSSIILYSAAVAAGFMTIAKVIGNHKSFVAYAVITILLFALGILGVNVSSIFY